LAHFGPFWPILAHFGLNEDGCSSNSQTNEYIARNMAPIETIPFVLNSCTHGLKHIIDSILWDDNWVWPILAISANLALRPFIWLAL
jgi:hypothetical protein